TLFFFPKVFPKGNPMVHGEVGSRRPDVHTWRHRPHGGSTPVGANACGSLAVLQQAALRFALHHRIPLRISLLLIFGFPFFVVPKGNTPLLYKPLGHRAEAPPHGQVTPTLPEESWGQVYTFVLWIPEGESDGTRRTSLAPTRLHTWRSGPTTKGKPRRFARQAALRFALHHRTPLLYKPLGHRAEAPPHGQVAPTLPEESWGQVYTFVLRIPEGESDGTRRTSLAPTRLHTWRSGPTTKGKPRRFALQAALRFALHHRTPLLYKPLGHRADAPPHRQVASSLPEESWGQVYTFFFLPKGRVGAECTVFFFPEGESWGQVYTFLFPKERVGAKCTLGFFPKVFPKGNPMVHGELASRRPGCILGGVAPQQRESLAVLLARLRSDSPCTIGPPLLYKPLGLRAEPPAHRQVAPPLPEESWGQVYTFHFPRFRVGKPPGLGSLLSVVRPPLHSTGYRNPCHPLVLELTLEDALLLPYTPPDPRNANFPLKGTDAHTPFFFFFFFLGLGDDPPLHLPSSGKMG